ncbi:MAG TPA: glycosyltransferase family 1 protein, partial [Dehalococcoidia bacterium]|nr:glycosyltransferase family 1 protein [Dehalococcoidia bacterium]
LAMRIGFDATVLSPGTRHTGMGQYAENLLRVLPGLAPDDEFVLYGSPPAAGFPPAARNVTWHEVGRLPIGRLSTLVGHLVLVPRLARRHRLDLLHVPAVHTRASLPPVPRRLPCPLVVTLHDLIPMNYYGRADKPLPWRLRTYYRWNLNSALKAQTIITVSENSRSEILDTLHVPTGRVVAIHNGIDQSWREGSEEPGPDFQLPDGPYVLFGGSFEPRKNLSRLLRAFDQACRDGLSNRLVMIVDAGSAHADPVMDLARSLPCAGRLTFLSGLDEPSIRAVYRSADAFVFPTLSEGFGLPPLQALACGVPVIASDIPVMREVLGDAASYFDPYSVEQMAHALASVTGDASLRRGLAAAGPARASAVSWEAAGRATLEVYRSVVAVRT